MQKETLLDLLAEVSTKLDSGIFEVDEKDHAAILLATGGPLFTIEDVRTMEVRQGYLVIKVGLRGNVFLVDLDRIIGIKCHHEKKEGAGFLG